MSNLFDYIINNNIIIDNNIYINWKVVIELFDDDFDFYKLLFDNFIIEINDNIKNILFYNINTIKHIIHKLKGTALTLGLYNLSSILYFYSNNKNSIDTNFVNTINKSIYNTQNEFNKYYLDINNKMK
jgi:hypothetical protein